MSDAELYERAVAAAERAYAPYSNYHVGAAALTRDGTVLEGVNVENAAYPLGVCAERTVLAARSSPATGPGTSRPWRSPPRPAAAAGSGCIEFKVGRVVFPSARRARPSGRRPSFCPDAWDEL